MRPNGCHNRADFAPTTLMQDGWRTTIDPMMLRPVREAILTELPFRMSLRCEYTATSELGQADKRCNGCERRVSIVAYQHGDAVVLALETGAHVRVIELVPGQPWPGAPTASAPCR